MFECVERVTNGLRDEDLNGPQRVLLMFEYVKRISGGTREENLNRRYAVGWGVNVLRVSVVTASTVIACVADVRKEMGRELGRESTRERGGRREEGGGRRGTPARKPLCSPSRLLIKKITKITQLWMTSCQTCLAAIHVVFLALFFFCFPNTRNLK